MNETIIFPTGKCGLLFVYIGALLHRVWKFTPRHSELSRESVLTSCVWLYLSSFKISSFQPGTFNISYVAVITAVDKHDSL